MSLRPKQVAYFEWLFLLAILMSVALLLPDLQRLLEAPLRLAIIGASLTVNLLLILATSRLRSNVAKWILIILTLAGWAMSASFATWSNASILAAVALSLQAAGLALLFTRPARSWFAKTGASGVSDVAIPGGDDGAVS